MTHSQAHRFSKQSGLQLFAAAFGLVVSMSSATAGDDVAHTALSLSEMDFTTEEGLVLAMVDIEQAAWTVCSQVKPAGSRERDFMSSCQRRTARQTVAQINDERLTAHYEEKSQLRIVGRAAQFFDRFRD